MPKRKLETPYTGHEDSLHKKGSIHSGVSAYQDGVRIRHPEFPKKKDPPPTEIINLLGGQSTEKITDLDVPCVPAADTKCYPLDKFTRTVTPAGYSPGDTWATGTAYGLKVTDGVLTAWYYFALADGPIASSTGTGACPYTSTECTEGCEGMAFTFGGWFEWETWYKLTVPAHPASMAGAIFGPIHPKMFTGISGGTVGIAEGMVVKVSPTQPTMHGQGTVIAAIPNLTNTSVFVPGNLIPAEGGTFWVGVAPNWKANSGEISCGFRWPWMNGDNNSGRGTTTATKTMIWQTWDAGSDDWGSALSDDVTDAWWEGNLPWEVTASGGTFGINGESLFLTASAGSQQTLVARMEGTSNADVDDSNDDPLGEPWSHHLGVAMHVRFRLTTAGSVSESGSRYLSAKWNDGRDELTIIAQLGDPQYQQGIRISDNDGSEYKKKDIEEGTWSWLRLDSRNPEYLHGKMWAEGTQKGSNEPAAWDVTLQRGDDTDNPVSDDYFQLALSVGNGTGADQTIEVDEIWFCGPGDDCEWVTEKIGTGNGNTVAMATSMPYKTGGLWFFVDGHHIPSETIDNTMGSFTGKVAPATGTHLYARYLVDRNPDGD